MQVKSVCYGTIYLRSRTAETETYLLPDNSAYLHVEDQQG